MPELSPLLETKQEVEKELIYPHRCPICDIETSYVYHIEDGKTHEYSCWYRCQCGVIFQGELPTDSKVYTDEYAAKLFTAKEGKQRYGLYVRNYAPLLEDLTYGRMMLNVGYATPYINQDFEDRGWLTWAIDINPALTGQGNIYQGDFCNYDFSLSGPKIKEFTGKEKIDRIFDVIWMGHVLEHFHNPIEALKKAYNLLEDKGVIFIATPDIDFINKTGAGGWDHFKKNEHYTMWSERALCRELEKIGFNIVLKRRNFSARYMSWWDLHIIAQKNYF